MVQQGCLMEKASDPSLRNQTVICTYLRVLLIDFVVVMERVRRHQQSPIAHNKAGFDPRRY